MLRNVLVMIFLPQPSFAHLHLLPGRTFYCCARADGPPPVGRCDFFQWDSRRQVAGSAASGGASSKGAGGWQSNSGSWGMQPANKKQKPN